MSVIKVRFRGRRFAPIGGAGILILPLLFAAGCSPATAHVLDWGIEDRTTEVTTHVPDGGSFAIQPGDTYQVVFDVMDPVGVKSMSVSAGGMFTCITRPDQNDTIWTAPDPLPAGLAPTQYTLPSSSTQAFLISNNYQSFTYDQIDCGIHAYQGPPGPEDYFATSGTLQFTGTETDVNGSQTTATLGISPASG